MEFSAFMKNLEKEKERMYKKSWHILNECLNGEEIKKEQVETGKYIINRKDGMPSQKIIGDENSPLVLKLNDNEITNRIKEIENRITELQGGKITQDESGKNKEGLNVSNGRNSTLSPYGKSPQRTGGISQEGKQEVNNTSPKNTSKNNNDNNKLGNSATDTQ